MSLLTPSQWLLIAVFVGSLGWAWYDRKVRYWWTHMSLAVAAGALALFTDFLVLRCMFSSIALAMVIMTVHRKWVRVQLARLDAKGAKGQNSARLF